MLRFCGHKHSWRSVLVIVTHHHHTPSETCHKIQSKYTCAVCFNIVLTCIVLPVSYISSKFSVSYVVWRLYGHKQQLEKRVCMKGSAVLMVVYTHHHLKHAILLQTIDNTVLRTVYLCADLCSVGDATSAYHTV